MEQVKSSQIVIRARFEPVLDGSEIQALVGHLARDHHVRIIEVDPDLANHRVVLMFGGRRSRVLHTFLNGLVSWERYQAGSDGESRPRCWARISPLSLTKLPSLVKQVQSMLPVPVGTAGWQTGQRSSPGANPEKPAPSVHKMLNTMDLKVLVTPWPVLFAIVLATEDLNSVETLLMALTCFQGEVSREVNPMALYSLRREYDSIYKNLSQLHTILDDAGMAHRIRVICRVANYRLQPLAQIYAQLNEVFRHFSLRVQGCQVLGYVPLESLLSSSKLILPSTSFSQRAPLDTKLDYLIKRLHLDEVEPFHVHRQILDFLLQPELVEEIYSSRAN